MNNEEVIFGTGCFWCTEAIFKTVEGIIKTEVGYAGGHTLNPTYEQVCSGQTGHAEVTKIYYNPEIISFEKLLQVFFKAHDPTSLNRQGNDVGTQYRSIILYTTEEQKKLAEKEIDKTPGAVTQVMKLDKFYPAENYHENYFAKNKSAPYCQMVIAPKLEHFE